MKVIKFLLVWIFILGESFLCCQQERIRDYLKAGTFWYPASQSELKQLLKELFQKAKKNHYPGPIRGLIVPHAGYSASGQCAARGFKQLEEAKGIHRVILLGLSHSSQFYGACVSTFTAETTPLGKIKVDQAIVQKLAKEKRFQVDNQIMQYEHSLENQLPFLQYILPPDSFSIVPILFGQLNKEDVSLMARVIKKYIDENTLVVASTDLTHYGHNYGYVPFDERIPEQLTQLDKGFIEPVLQFNVDACYKYKQKTDITVCGFIPVAVFMQLFPPSNSKGYLVDYYKSGDLNGDYQLSVSYAAVAVVSEKGGGMTEKKDPKDQIVNLNNEEKKTLLAIARRALNTYLSGQAKLTNLEKEFSITPVLRQTMGVFVTLKKKDQLRGCIGSIIGQKPLFAGVAENAVNAGFYDPRFDPVRAEEMKDIHIDISVMTPLQKIADYRQIRLGIDGIILGRGGRQAVFLPQVATETGWNLDRFLSQLCLKAGLPGDSYTKPGMDFYIFQANVFAE